VMAVVMGVQPSDPDPQATEQPKRDEAADAKN